MTTDGPRRLRRSQDRKIAGVAAGIAEYLDLDPTLVRLGFVIVALLGFGTVVVGYLVLWLVMPAAGSESTPSQAAEPQSKLLLAVLAVVLVLSLAGGLAWPSMFNLHLLRVSLPVWVVIIVGAYLIMRSRRARAS
ncbi:MAG: PspC domain-containing protein [Dehalococcoidia bacterium]